MGKKILVVIFVMFVIVTGCARHSNYRPVVDSYNDPNAGRLGADLEECRMLALDAAEQRENDAGKSALITGLLGAAAGAAIGAAVGSPGTGAAVGAAAGGIGGGGGKIMSADDRYEQVYRNCMRNRGHNVID